MALFKFTKAILAGQPIDVYNFGEMKRDFTFIDDIAEAIIHLAEVIPQTRCGLDGRNRLSGGKFRTIPGI